MIVGCLFCTIFWVVSACVFIVNTRNMVEKDALCSLSKEEESVVFWKP